MKMRWGSMLVIVGLVLIVIGLTGPGLAPRSAQATTTNCTPSSDLYHCYAYGATAGGIGFEVDNQSGATNSVAIFGYAPATTTNSPTYE